MTENTKLWDRLGKTDPAHTKGFKRGGGFSGTAIKPQWVIRRLTEEFGPCGQGWGMHGPEFQVVPAGNEVLVFCTIQAWYGSPENYVWGVGGDKVLAQRSSGGFSDDEAFKKAYTDALMNAFKFIGVGADVHMGLFDDSKYVQEAKAEFSRPKEAPGKLDVQPEGLDWWGAVGSGLSAAEAKRQGLGDSMDKWLGDLNNVSTVQGWKDFCAEISDDVKRMPMGWRVHMRNEAEARGRELGAIGDQG